MSGRSWTLLIPAPCWLTANDRRIPRAKAGDIAAWRLAAFERAKLAKLPRGLDRVRIDCVAFIHGQNKVVREADNLAPTRKAAVDGLGPDRRTARTPRAVGYGLVPDDSDEHVELTAVRIERLPAHPYRLGHLQLTITDLSEDT